MIQRIVTAALISLTAISFTACNSSDFQKTKDGLEYRIVTDKKEGKAPDSTDFVKLRVRIYYTEKGKKDTLLNDLVKMNGGEPLELPMTMPLSFKSDWPSGLHLLTPGDSALFRTPVDTIMKIAQGQLPPFMKKGGYILYSVVMVSVRSNDDIKKEQEQKSAQQKDIDDKMLQDYFAQNKLSPSKTETGLYYIIDKEGTGSTPQKGDSVTVNYTGKTLDGKTFDSNVDPQFQHVQPFTFASKAGGVIPGWDEGVALLNKGSRARLFIPSTLGYGSQGSQALPANSILIFDIEVKNIKAGAFAQ